ELLGISDGVTPHPERLARQIAPRFIDILAQVEVNIEELRQRLEEQESRLQEQLQEQAELQHQLQQHLEQEQQLQRELREQLERDLEALGMDLNDIDRQGDSKMERKVAITTAKGSRAPHSASILSSEEEKAELRKRRAKLMESMHGLWSLSNGGLVKSRLKKTDVTKPLVKKFFEHSSIYMLAKPGSSRRALPEMAGHVSYCYAPTAARAAPAVVTRPRIYLLPRTASAGYTSFWPNFPAKAASVPWRDRSLATGPPKMERIYASTAVCTWPADTGARAHRHGADDDDEDPRVCTQASGRFGGPGAEFRSAPAEGGRSQLQRYTNF
ncbi:unnamed protein product, partial [Symbiodinium sp. KB8]